MERAPTLFVVFFYQFWFLHCHTNDLLYRWMWTCAGGGTQERAHHYAGEGEELADPRTVPGAQPAVVAVVDVDVRDVARPAAAAHRGPAYRRRQRLRLTPLPLPPTYSVPATELSLI